MFRKHPILAVISTLLILLLLAMFATGAMIMNAAAGSRGEFEYLIVLGTTVEGIEPSPMLADRIQRAYDYLKTRPEITCIVTGYQSGSGEISEAECMYRDLVSLGISPDRIWMEPNASSTLENLEFSLALIEEKTGSRPEAIGILSSDFHLFRAGMFARECGVEYFTVAAKTPDRDFPYWFIREIIMVWYYSIF